MGCADSLPVVVVEAAAVQFKRFRDSTAQGVLPLKGSLCASAATVRKFFNQMYPSSLHCTDTVVTLVITSLNRERRRWGPSLDLLSTRKEGFEGISPWNASVRISNTDDLEFLCELQLELQKQYDWHSNKTFVNGVVNGVSWLPRWRQKNLKSSRQKLL